MFTTRPRQRQSTAEPWYLAWSRYLAHTTQHIPEHASTHLPTAWQTCSWLCLSSAVLGNGLQVCAPWLILPEGTGTGWHTKLRALGNIGKAGQSPCGGKQYCSAAIWTEPRQVKAGARKASGTKAELVYLQIKGQCWPRVSASQNGIDCSCTTNGQNCLRPLHSSMWQLGYGSRNRGLSPCQKPSIWAGENAGKGLWKV